MYRSSYPQYRFKEKEEVEEKLKLTPKEREKYYDFLREEDFKHPNVDSVGVTEDYNKDHQYSESNTINDNVNKENIVKKEVVGNSKKSKPIENKGKNFIPQIKKESKEQKEVNKEVRKEVNKETKYDFKTIINANKEKLMKFRKFIVLDNSIPNNEKIKNLMQINSQIIKKNNQLAKEKSTAKSNKIEAKVAKPELPVKIEQIVLLPKTKEVNSSTNIEMEILEDTSNKMEKPEIKQEINLEKPDETKKTSIQPKKRIKFQNTAIFSHDLVDDHVDFNGKSENEKQNNSINKNIEKLNMKQDVVNNVNMRVANRPNSFVDNFSLDSVSKYVNNIKMDIDPVKIGIYYLILIHYILFKYLSHKLI